MARRSGGRSERLRSLLGGGALAALLAVLLLVQFVDERARALQEQQARNAMHARLLIEAVSRSVESASLALATLSDQSGFAGGGRGMIGAQALAQLLAGQPALRSVAVLNPAGAILASSVSAEVGLQIDPVKLGPLRAVGLDALGPYIEGRGLSQLAMPAPATKTPPGLGFVPLTRQVDSADGRLLLVGVLHPEALAEVLQLVADEPGLRTLLASHDGQWIAGAQDRVPNTKLAEHPVFRDLLQERTNGTYIGAGTVDGEAAVAYRASAQRPLVAVIERPVADVRAQWLAQSRGRIAVSAFAVLAVLASTLVAARAAGARDAARRRLNRAQGQVVRRERELSDIVRSVQELLFRTDTQGTLVFINARWTQIRAFGDPVVEGSRLDDLVRAEDADLARALFADDGVTGVRTSTVTLRLGGGRRVDLAVLPLLEDGRVTGYAGSAVDVTVRLQAQEQLQRELAFIEKMLDLIPLPVSIFNAERQYLAVNRAWQAFTGRSAQDALGGPAGAGLPNEQSALHAAQDRRVLVQSEPLRYEAPYTRPDGSRHDLVVSKVRIPAQTGPGHGILCTFLDVTDLHDAQRAALEAKDAVEAAARDRSAWVAAAGLELRLPLQTLIGQAQQGWSRAQGQDDQAPEFAEILQTGQRLLTLVDSLIDVARIDSPHGALRLTLTDLRPLIRAVQDEIGPLASTRQLTVESHLPARPLLAQVQPDRFQQVLRQVLRNAVRVSPQGQRIVVDARRTDDGGIEISVADRGTGIPPSDLVGLFEGPVAAPARSGGGGLGLAICRRIMEAHGGSIRAENIDDGGARLLIRLPARDGAEARSAPQPS